MRRAWIIVGSLITVVALGFATLNFIGVLAHEELIETADFDAAGLTAVDVAVENGSVEIVGGDGDEVRLVAEISHGLRRTGHRAEVEGSTLVVRSSCPVLSTWCSVDYRLEVPADLAVTARSDNGRLAIRDVDGPVAVDSDNGSIELTRLSGSVTGSTDNGSLVASGLRSGNVTADSDNGRVSLAFAAAPDDVEATTDNGSVEVVVPDDATTYLVDIDSQHGSTDIGVRTDPDSERLIRGRTQNGNVTVRYPTG
jgi:hypothetical protein